MPGRQKAKVTTLFKDVESTTKIKRVKCSFCSLTLAKSGSRLSQHILQCRKCPKEIKNKYLEIDVGSEASNISEFTSKAANIKNISTNQNKGNISSVKRSLTLIDPIPIASTSTAGLVTIEECSTSPPKKIKASMNLFVDKITNEENNLISNALSRAIFGSGTPFSIVEHPLWKTFFSLIRPAYKPPTRKMLASTLLDNEMKIISTTVVEAVASCDAVGLMCDGWSNIRNQPIINFVLTTPEPVFWKTIASGTISHTGEYISEEIIKVIEEINAKTDTKVLGIVTDNAANMKKAWQLVKEKYPTVICYGCAAHSLDLIFSDLNKLSSLKSLMSKVISIVKEFKQSHILGEFLRKYQGQKAISLKLPVKTRWGSTVICLKSLHINKHALMKLIVDKDQEENKGIKISNQTEVNILSQPFWDAVNGCILLLSPLADAIAKVESNKPMLSNILPIFDSLKETFDTYIRQSPLSGADEIQALKILEDRREFCIKTIHKAANLLDPRFFGSSLSPEEQVDVMEFISEIAERMPAVDQEKVLTDLSHYLAKEQFFSKKFLWIAADSASPTAWWTGFCRSTELSKVASAFLKLPATTAAVERSFSTYANIHTARRNRLSTKRAGKLVYVSQNLKLQNPASNVKIPTKNIETSKVQATSSHDSHESLSISETIAVDSELEVTTASSSEIDSSE